MTQFKQDQYIICLSSFRMVVQLNGHDFSLQLLLPLTTWYGVTSQQPRALVSFYKTTAQESLC